MGRVFGADVMMESRASRPNIRRHRMRLKEQETELRPSEDKRKEARLVRVEREDAPCRIIQVHEKGSIDPVAIV